MESNLFSEINNATNSIYGICNITSLVFSSELSTNTGVKIFLKKEHEQITGSFKLRGATYKLLKISHEEHNKDKTIVTASTGNHGIATSFACNKLNELSHSYDSLTRFKCIIYAPNHVDELKSSLILQNNAKLIKISTNNCLDAEKTAKEFASTEGAFYISPYNDYDIIAGQGTLGREILNDMENKCDAVFVSIGGGGLISGIATYIKNVNPECKVIGCQPYNSRVIYESIKVGKVLQDLPEYDTVSDATAGGVEDDLLTFPIIENNVDDIILATEEEIYEAFCMIEETDRITVEGSAALTLACLMKTKERWQGRRVVLVLCGKNISIEKINLMRGYYSKNKISEQIKY